VTPPEPASTGLDPWSLLARLRKGRPPYQPEPESAAGDPNGCIPKLDLLLATRFDFAGKSMVSLGASGALYESRLARRSPGVRAAHMIDTDPASLKQAEERFAPAAVAELRLIQCRAHDFAFRRDYDVCFFLSLFHHYDRLGGAHREQGFAVLRDIGRHCATLFFETGQSDDTVPGSEEWPRFLEMAGGVSPVEWLESRIPEVTGYDAFRRLGTNPRTRRHMYVFWRRRPAVLDAALLDGAARLRVDLAEGGEPVVGGAPLAAALPAGPVVLDLAFTGAETPDEIRFPGAARVAEAVRELAPERVAVGVRDTALARAVPAECELCLVAAADEEGALAAVETAAYSGVGLVALAPGALSAAVRAAALDFGVRAVVTGAPPA